MENVVTGSAVAAILGILVSLALESVPGLREWWAPWPGKRLAWLAGCLLVPLVWVGLAYLGAPVGFAPIGPFIWDGLYVVLSAAFAAYYAGQGTFAAQANAGKLAPR